MKANRIIRRIPTGLCSVLMTLVVAYLSLTSNTLSFGSLFNFEGADKVVHFFMYLALTIIYILDYAKARMPHHAKLDVEIVLTILAISIGVIMELLQEFLGTGRSFELLDAVADAIGAIVALLLIEFYLMHAWRKWMMGAYVHHKHRRKNDDIS